MLIIHKLLQLQKITLKKVLPGITKRRFIVFFLIPASTIQKNDWRENIFYCQESFLFIYLLGMPT